MISRKVMLLSTIAGVLMTAGAARADLIELSGVGAASGAPLTASLAIEVIDPTTLVMTLTNDATLGGADNRITYFGFQMPTAGVAITVDPASAGGWSGQQHGKLPGAGANTFNWLYQTSDRGGAAGLNLGQSLMLNVSAATPMFDPLDTGDWAATRKDGYRFAAKFQSVGADAEDSGVAMQFTPRRVEIPEPASVALMGLAGLFIAGRPRRAGRAGAFADRSSTGSTG